MDFLNWSNRTGNVVCPTDIDEKKIRMMGASRRKIPKRRSVFIATPFFHVATRLFRPPRTDGLVSFLSAILASLKRIIRTIRAFASRISLQTLSRAFGSRL